MLARLMLALASSLVFAQNVDPLKKESENIGRKHDAKAPEVQAVQPQEKPQEKKEEPRKVYLPVERRVPSLSITRAKSIVEERKEKEKEREKEQKQERQGKENDQTAQAKPELEPVKGVCVLQEEVRVRNARRFTEMPCLVIYPDNKVVKARAVFEPDSKNFLLRGKILVLDGKPEDLTLLRSGSENLPAEVKKYLLANALVSSMGKTTEQTAKVVENASRSEVSVQLGNNNVRAGVSFTEVVKKLPVISGLFALGNFAQGLAQAIAPQGQIPPEFILPAGTELYFSRP